MSDLVRFGVSIDAALVGAFDKIIDKRGYSSRSEAIRDLIRETLIEEESSGENEEAVGVITIVYDHEQRQLSRKLTDLQHGFSRGIISTLHIHLDRRNCLEAVVVKDSNRRLKKMADALISTKGVKHGKLVTTTTGKYLT